MNTINRAKITGFLDTKEYILQIAGELFSQYSYNSVSMSDIAKKVKIAKASLYHHFCSKQELYFQVLEKSFKELTKILEKSLVGQVLSKKKLYNIIITYINFGLQKKDLVQLTIHKMSKADREIIDRITELEEHIIDQLQSLIEKVILKVKIKREDRDFDSRLAAYLLKGMMDVFIARETIIGKTKWNAKKVAEQITFFFSQKYLVSELKK